MRRRLIAQGGGGGMTMYIPKKWLTTHSLSPGDELDIEEFENSLMLTPSTTKSAKREISLDLNESKHVSVTNLLSNAYRSGFDKIEVLHVQDIEKMHKAVDELLIGFEVTKESDKSIVIESVSEPSYENFENMVNRLFYIAKEMIQDPLSSRTKDHAKKFQRYQSFLLRCISKKVYSPKSEHWMWHFLAMFHQAVRFTLHLGLELNKRDKDLSDHEKKSLKSTLEIFEVLQKSYQSQDLSLIAKIQDLGQKVVYDQGRGHLDQGDALINHYIMSISRQLYICSSSLSGLLEMETFAQAKRPGK